MVLSEISNARSAFWCSSVSHITNALLMKCAGSTASVPREQNVPTL